ncbi:hypothetical protein WR25_22236 isoform B [Diploscapter pachys]|uniref:Sodium/phosphate cotransporter 2A n=1 Tax=Diploscapter pachys TaxID=2018661 RepID=A0A2A2L768_9BILA|nr:hypothetical protein WR25_22236 isoform A [Diploscapter pachys]PAV82024.1 hypothetical protein WR25_22236 isoform B [Diploscapter pachys]
MKVADNGSWNENGIDEGTKQAKQSRAAWSVAAAPSEADHSITQTSSGSNSPEMPLPQKSPNKSSSPVPSPGIYRLKCAMYIFAVCLSLFIYICCLSNISSAFSLLGSKGLVKAIQVSPLINDPISAVVVGMLATVILQSPQTTTNVLVSMVAANMLTVHDAIPVMIGSELGSSLVNGLVSIAYSSDPKQKLLSKECPGAWKPCTGYTVMLVGLLVTLLLQSNSIFNSSLTPMVGSGVVTLEEMYPLVMGSNIGGSFSGVLAALSADSSRFEKSLHMAMCQVLYNIFGTLMFYVVPATRQLPLYMSKRLGQIENEVFIHYMIVC